jgi:prevent-host-death family protein
MWLQQGECKMPRQIGIRELKNQTSDVLRQVREEAAEYVITCHGNPVALLRPLESADAERWQKQRARDSWQTLLELGTLLAESAPSARSPVEILAELRGEESEWPSQMPA